MVSPSFVCEDRRGFLFVSYFALVYEYIQLTNIMRKITNIILHCTATEEGKDFHAKDIRQWHLNNGWSDIGYHYVIDLDGTIESGRSELLTGAHCSGHNANSIGVVYVGGLRNGKPADTRTPEQKKALLDVVRDLAERYGLGKYNIHCHNQYSNKACPCFTIDSFREELTGSL